MFSTRCLSSSVRRGRYTDIVVVERYSIISRFFRQQIQASHPSRPQSARKNLVRDSAELSLIASKLRPRAVEVLIRANRASTLTSGNRREFRAHSRVEHTPKVRLQDKGKDGSVENLRKDGEASNVTDATSQKGLHAGPHYAKNYSRFFRRLARSLPPMHRPTRDDFLNVATGFWQRLRVRFKWFTVRSFRKFNADDISAFFTWFLVSQTAWIFLGTTTFFSVVLLTVNSLRMQKYVAKSISDYLTSETGITIVFESAIVPKWKDSRIAFKNVCVSRRPLSMKYAPSDADHNNAAHRAAARYDVGNHPVYHGLEDEHPRPTMESTEEIDYAIFDLNIDTVDVELSLSRWLDGKGLVKDAVIKGVRGMLDRQYIRYDPEHPLDPASFRHEAQNGDFQLESLQLEDVLITIYQPGAFRPYTASIFRADVKTFRKQWMFYDFLRAENVVGQFDNCLFSLHKPQSIGRTTEQDLQDGTWSRMSRVRVDGVNIDHLQRGTSMEGPIAWITSGKVDAVFDIKFPHETDDRAINEILEGIAEVITSVASTQAAGFIDRIPGQRELAKPPISAPDDPAVDHSDTPRVVSIDIDLRFRDLKAAVPIFTNELSYVNSALIRPIVAFINTNRTLVPVRCRIMKDIADFDGAWTMWETGLMDEIALKVYDALAYHVTHANFNRRVKTVSLWSLQKTAGAALSTLQTMMSPMSFYLQELNG